MSVCQLEANSLLIQPQMTAFSPPEGHWNKTSKGWRMQTMSACNRREDSDKKWGVLLTQKHLGSRIVAHWFPRRSSWKTSHRCCLSMKAARVIAHKIKQLWAKLFSSSSSSKNTLCGVSAPHQPPSALTTRKWRACVMPILVPLWWSQGH